MSERDRSSNQLGEGIYYEIAYRVTVNVQGDMVVIIMAGTRENFYKALKKYYKLRS